MLNEKTVVPFELAEWERFKKIMRIPMKDIKQEDLEWAYNQDKFNSANSKGLFEQEIKRRKKLQTEVYHLENLIEIGSMM